MGAIVQPAPVVSDAAGGFQDYRYRREYRLLTAGQFAETFSARKVVFGSRFALHYRINGGSGARLGLVIPKKQARSAVLRNAVKRQARELFRLRRGTLPSYDLVLRLMKPLAGKTLAERHNAQARTQWRAELAMLFDRLVTDRKN